MKCLKCGKIIEGGVKECPYCGNEIDNVEFELPKLKDTGILKTSEKEDNKVVISVGDEFQFEHEIPLVNNEVDNKNNLLDLNKMENAADNVDDNKIITIETTESVKKRKTILIVTSLIFLLLVIIGSTFVFVMSKTQKAKESTDYNVRLKNALQNYYDTENIDDLIYLLEEYKNDDKIVNEFQVQTKEMCDNWIVSYMESEPNNMDEFEDITSKYKLLITNLVEYAKVNNNDKEISYLKDSDYDELMLKIENIYDDGEDYVKAISLYNEKDYNKSYNTFKKVEDDNVFYKKANEYLKKITDNVLELLKNDIKKLEYSIDSLDDNGKAIRYKQIVFIINEYNSVYGTLNLNSNDEYKRILNEYKDKYSKYHKGSSTLGDTDISLNDMGNT